MSLDREEGKGAEFVDALRAELSSARPGLPEEVLLNQLALTLESLGRDAEARDIYERLVQDYPAIALLSDRDGAYRRPRGGRRSLRPAEWRRRTRSWLRKRAGRPLSAAEIETVVAGAVDGSWTEGQLAAFLMASAIHGLDPEETRHLTLAMLESGERWHLERRVPAPLRQALDRRGRRQGLPDPHPPSGGLRTAGIDVDRPRTGPYGRHRGQAGDHSGPGFGAGIAASACGFSSDWGWPSVSPPPASRRPIQRFYLLRDSTATVDSLPLITASILSKKLATGAAGLVLDVKVGNGAVFEEIEDARGLAQIMVDTASGLGCPTSALLTDMNEPLGRWVGNAAEIRESLECLSGAGPPRLMELVYALCEEAAELAGQPVPRQALEIATASGAAREKFEAWVGEQGGRVAELESSSRELAPVRGRDRGGVRWVSSARGLPRPGICAGRGGRRQKSPGRPDRSWSRPLLPGRPRAPAQPGRGDRPGLSPPRRPRPGPPSTPLLLGRPRADRGATGSRRASRRAELRESLGPPAGYSVLSPNL